MSNELRRIGVSLVAENGEAFVGVMQQASAGEKEVAQSSQSLAQQIMAAGASTTETVTALRQLGFTAAEARQMIGQAVTTLNQHTEAETRAVTETKALADASLSKNAALNEQAVAAEKSSGAHMSNIAVMREGRLVMGALAADMALLTIAAGEQMPQAMREAAKGIDLVIQGALMGALVGEGFGAVVGALAGGLLALFTATTTVDPALAALNKELETLASHDDAAAALAKLSGVTQTDAELALQWAKTHAEAADRLKELTKRTEDGTPILQGMGDAIRAVGDVLSILKTKIEEVLPVLRVLPDVAASVETKLEAGAAGAEAFVAALAHGKSVSEAWDANIAAEIEVLTHHAQATRDAAQATHEFAQAQREADILKERVSLDNSRLRAEEQYASEVQRINTSLNDELAALGQQRTAFELSNAQEAARAWQTEADAVARANRALNDSILSANRSLSDTLAKDAQSLADREADIARSVADKTADAQHQRANAYESADQEIAKQAQSLADKLVNITRTENEQMAALDFNTHSQLQSAKTDNEKESILERAAFDKSQIQQKANDQRSDAQKQFDEAKQLTEQKKALADEEFAYRLQVAQRSAAEEVANARRQYAEEVAAAQQRNAEQISDARRTNAEALADAQQRYGEQLAALTERLAAEELANAQQAERDRQRAAEQISNAKAQVTASHEMVGAVKGQAEAVSAAVGAVGTALEGTSRQASNDLIGNLNSAIVGIQNAGQEIVVWEQTVVSILHVIADTAVQGIGDVLGAISKNIHLPSLPNLSGFRTEGGEVEVGRSYIVGERGPEWFTPGTSGYIVPNSQLSNHTTNHNGGNTAVFNIYDATDPKKIVEVVRHELSQAVWR